MSITGDKYGKSLYTGPVHLYGVYRSDFSRRGIMCIYLNILSQNNDGGTKIGARIKPSREISVMSFFFITNLYLKRIKTVSNFQVDLSIAGFILLYFYRNFFNIRNILIVVY